MLKGKERLGDELLLFFEKKSRELTSCIEGDKFKSIKDK